MILTGPEIRRIVEAGKAYKEKYGPAAWNTINQAPSIPPVIDIEPFSLDQIGPNSYDVRLAPEIAYYEFAGPHHYLDPRADNPVVRGIIPESGATLYPGILYLCSTVEYTETFGLVPWLDGRSSVGRLGIHVHATAGRGDDGFRGRWTLELSVVHAVRVYPRMKIGQLTFFNITGTRDPYRGKYQAQTLPTPSKMFLDDPLEPLQEK